MTKKFKLKKVKDCEQRLSGEVKDPRLEECYQSVLNSFRQQAHLKGYRPGKAPQALIESQYAKEIEREVIGELVQETFIECLKQEKVEPITRPAVREVRFERGKKLTFSADFSTFPQFQIKKLEGLKLTQKKTQPKEDEIEGAIRQIAESRAVYSALENPRPAVQGDVLSCEAEPPAGAPEGAAGKEINFQIDMNGPQQEISKQLVGVSAGDVRSISLGQPAGAPGGAAHEFKIRIKEIRTKSVPPADDELARSMGRESIEELRKAIRDDMQKYRHWQERQSMAGQVNELLLKMHTVPLPEGIVEEEKKRIIKEAAEKQKESSAQPNAGAEKKPGRDENESARRKVKLFFLTEKIARQLNCLPTESEVAERIRQAAAETGKTPEEARAQYEDLIYHHLKQGKVMDYLINNAQVEETQG